MKIGILSMHKVVNYGSFLQAFALKGVLEGLGHDSFFIDIKPGRKIIEDNLAIKKGSKIAFVLKRLDRYFFKRIKHYFFVKQRASRFYDEFFPILGITKEPVFDSNYDAVVIGSDEVFNCTTKSSWGFAKTLFGEDLDADLIITYAASCGHTTLKDLDKYGITEEVKKAMINLVAISVRDKNTKQFSQTLLGKEIYEHIDPTLIYNFDQLIPKSVTEKNYILIYGYDGRINDKEMIRKIKDFVRKERKQVICAGVYQNWCDKQILCTPFELLAYFKNADYVVTDTFHGTVFSIKFNRQFATIVRESNKQKLTDLLEKFNLESRAISSPNELSKKLVEKISYEFTNSEIERYRKLANDYFELYLNKDRVGL